MDMRHVKILHITPHLGGGVGHVVLNWLQSDDKNNHIIATLDYANEESINICKKHNIELFQAVPTSEIINKINEVDIVIIHFWNHPLLYDFLIRNALPPCRLIMWSHISGKEPPNIFTDKILKYPDKFIFTSPISFDFVENKDKYECILSTGGINHILGLKNIKHDGFNLGYIGTVDYAKMHPDYIKVHKKIEADRFIIVGGNNEKEISKNTDSRFEFIGKVQNIKPYLAQMDIFAYLLNPKHFGTAEQVLQEAMAAGVVPVVLNNPCEASLVKHDETGFIAKNINEYIKYIELLKNDKITRARLSDNAKIYAKEMFSIENLISKWNQVIDDTLTLNKTEKLWEIENIYITPFDVFLESLGEYSHIFETNDNIEIKKILKEDNWSSNSKGTPKQYLLFFNNDKRLKKLCELYYE